MQTIHPQPATPAPAACGQAPYSLISQWQTHLKLNGRPPRTLAEKLQARADYEHAQRTAELKKLAAKLALLEPLLPELAARGVPVHDRDMALWDPLSTRAALTIYTGFLSSTDDKLHAALLELGFREVERKGYDSAQTEDVILKHGRALLVRIKVTAKPAAAPAAATAREEVAA